MARGTGQREPEQSDWEKEFLRLRPFYEQLATEVQFALNRDIRAAAIKTHDVLARCKTLESLREKAERKEYEQPLEQAEDLAGVRVVTLFMSDLPKVDEIIRLHVDVQSEEDTIEGGDVSIFGYMSKHYVGTLAKHYSGARYDDIKGLKVEVQLRTIVMDAWANVSHHLAYKSDESIPRELRRQFSALSGLVYVADQQFEALFAGSGLVQERAVVELEASGTRRAALELNLETLAAFLLERYPSRVHSHRGAVAELVDDLREAGYQTLGEVEARLDEAADLFHAEETGRKRPYHDVGIVRVSVGLVDSEFEEITFRNTFDRLDQDKPRDEPT